MEIVEKIVSWSANLIQIGTALFTLFVIWQARQRLQRYAERSRHEEGAVVMALAIGIGGSIRARCGPTWTTTASLLWKSRS